MINTRATNPIANNLLNHNISVGVTDISFLRWYFKVELRQIRSFTYLQRILLLNCYQFYPFLDVSAVQQKKKWKSICREAGKNAKQQTLLISMHTPSAPIPWRFTCCVHTWTRWMLPVLCTTKVDGSILIRHPSSVRNIFLGMFTQISALDATLRFALNCLSGLFFHLRQKFMIIDRYQQCGHHLAMCLNQTCILKKRTQFVFYRFKTNPPNNLR